MDSFVLQWSAGFYCKLYTHTFRCYRNSFTSFRAKFKHIFNIFKVVVFCFVSVNNCFYFYWPDSCGYFVSAFTFCIYFPTTITHACGIAPKKNQGREGKIQTFYKRIEFCLYYCHYYCGCFELLLLLFGYFFYFFFLLSKH